MAGETVVLDSNNLAAIIADATGEPLEKPAEPEKPAAEAKPAKVEKPAEKASEPDPDGLTEDERKTYTEKMRKSVAWRHGKMREAQEQAARERQGRIAAEERASTAQKELEQLRVQPRIAPQEPVAANFETTEAFIAAKVKWDVTQELAKEREERRKAEEKAENERVLATARSRIAKAIELVPDYQEVVGSVDLTVPNHIAGYMQESEMFAELGYFFAQHPDELDRISRLKPGASLVALGKIESKLEPFGPAASKTPQSKVEPNGGSEKPSTAADGIPSRPRVSVPVVQPLVARGAPEVESESGEINGRKAVTSFEKRTGHTLTRRQRH